jgi:hypothetical protein
MPEFITTIHVIADSETEVEKLLDKVSWIDSYDSIDEVEVLSDDDEDDEE